MLNIVMSYVNNIEWSFMWAFLGEDKCFIGSQEGSMQNKSIKLWYSSPIIRIAQNHLILFSVKNYVNNKII